MPTPVTTPAQASPCLDRLSPLLERFPAAHPVPQRAALCGDALCGGSGRGFCTLRRGEMVVTHQPQAGPAERLQVYEPSLLFLCPTAGALLSQRAHLRARTSPAPRWTLTAAPATLPGRAPAPAGGAAAGRGGRAAAVAGPAVCRNRRCGTATACWPTACLKWLCCSCCAGCWTTRSRRRCRRPAGRAWPTRNLRAPSRPCRRPASHGAWRRWLQQAAMSRSAFAARFKAVVGDARRLPGALAADAGAGAPPARAGRSSPSPTNWAMPTPRRCRACLRKSWGCQRGTGAGGGRRTLTRRPGSAAGSPRSPGTGFQTKSGGCASGICATSY